MIVRDFNPHLGSKDDVIRDHMGLARSVAKRFRWAASHTAHIDFQDIVSEAYIGLMKAYDKFDGRVPKFTTYAAPMIQWEIQQFLRRKGQSISIPQKLYLLIGNIFRNDLQHSTLAEIADRLACSEMEAARALKYLREGRSAASLDQPVLSPKDGAEDSCLHDFIGQAPDLTSAHVGEFMAKLGPEEREFVQIRTAGVRIEQPILLGSVRTKLAAYMGLDESEVEQMSHELTKEKYLQLKAQQRSDEAIAIDFSIGKSKLHRIKNSWGLTGAGMGKTAFKKSNPKSTNASAEKAGQLPQTAAPIPADAVDWKSQYDDLSKLVAERGFSDTAKISRLEQEVVLLKGMLKFYL